MALRTGKITEFDVPRTGEEVIDPEFGRGTVASQPKGGGLWIQFQDVEGLMFYTYRRALDEWRLFPAPASRAGLQM